MIGRAIIGLALGSVQSSSEKLAQNARCMPVSTLMGWDAHQERPQLRHIPQADQPPTGGRPRGQGRPRLRPCVHLANG